MKGFRSGWGSRQWGVALAAIAGAILIGVLVVRAFTSTAPDSATGTDLGEPPAATDSAPPFSIPKVQGCSAPDTATQLRISRTLAPATELGKSVRTTDGATTYIAAAITSGGQPARDEPGLWAVRGGQLYAIGATTAISTAADGTPIGLFGTSDAAQRAISCATGY